MDDASGGVGMGVAVGGGVPRGGCALGVAVGSGVEVGGALGVAVGSGVWVEVGLGVEVGEEVGFSASAAAVASNAQVGVAFGSKVAGFFTSWGGAEVVGD